MSEPCLPNLLLVRDSHWLAPLDASDQDPRLQEAATRSSSPFLPDQHSFLLGHPSLPSHLINSTTRGQEFAKEREKYKRRREELGALARKPFK